jgi:hypothetical protein
MREYYYGILDNKLERTRNLHGSTRLGIHARLSCKKLNVDVSMLDGKLIITAQHGKKMLTLCEVPVETVLSEVKGVKNEQT